MKPCPHKSLNTLSLVLKKKKNTREPGTFKNPPVYSYKTLGFNPEALIVFHFAAVATLKSSFFSKDRRCVQLHITQITCPDTKAN